MKYLIIILFALLIKGSSAQRIDWGNSNNWKIYRLKGHGIFSYSIDTLSNFKYYPLNEDSMRKFMQNASAVPKDSTPVWMGAYVASCLLKGKLVKVEISNYGGFFYCEADRCIYQIPIVLKNEWQDYIAQCYRNLYP